MTTSSLTTPNLILASTSKYRQELLTRLSLPFTAVAPLFDEETEKQNPLPPQQLAEKLAYLKAQSLAQVGKTVIGGDQLVALDNEILGKSHTYEGAIHQLKKMRGRQHQLITAVCVFHGEKAIPLTNITTLWMKNLTDEQIHRYVELDTPFDCAGSYKIEKHGIALFDKIETSDFTAIQGLPLIELSQILKDCGLPVLMASLS